MENFLQKSRKKIGSSVAILILFVAPASTNYELQNHSFGSGDSHVSSTNYQLQGTTGEIGINDLSSSNFRSWNGLSYTQLAPVPPAPTFTNPSNSSNQLQLVIVPQDNASDAEFAIAISSDNFSSDTRYVQADGTVGATLPSGAWQTYAAWGGAGGVAVVGLNGSTTYTVKVKSRQGDFTEGPWGPTAQAATAGTTLSFDIDVSSSDQETSSPYSVSLGELTPGSVTTASNKIWIDLSTSAAQGATILIKGEQGGLYSSSTTALISAVSADLNSEQEGIGLQSATDSETSGGPLTPLSPYAGASNTVGTIPTTAFNPVYSTSQVAITGGRGSLSVKAKASALTPAATDFSETVTLVAVGNF